jgi:predicted nucleotidyltransferase
MADTGIPGNITIPLDDIAAFCERWEIAEFALFGSVLRDDFGPESDIDVLVTFKPGVIRSLLDFPAMQDELQAMFGRPVDVVNRTGVERSENWIRRRAILGSSRTVYAA